MPADGSDGAPSIWAVPSVSELRKRWFVRALAESPAVDAHVVRPHQLPGEAMPAEPGPVDRAALENIVGQLEAAWNAMDGSAFAGPFADDADFVTIRGEHFRGRPAIANGH